MHGAPGPDPDVLNASRGDSQVSFSAGTNLEDMSSMKPTKGPIIFADVRTKSRRCLFDRSLVLLCSISALLLWFQPLCLSNLLGYRISAANDVQANLVGTVKWWRCTGFHDDFRAECGYIMYVVTFHRARVPHLSAVVHSVLLWITIILMLVTHTSHSPVSQL